MTLITPDKTDWRLLRKRYGLSCSLDDEVFLIPGRLDTPSLTLRVIVTLLSYFIHIFDISLRKKYDLLINTSGEIINLTEDIAYINAVPMRIAYNYPKSLPLKNNLWKCYSRFYNLLLKSLDNLNTNIILLTNSRFNKDIINTCLKRQTKIIHPPVDVKEFKPSSRLRKRGNLVVTVSRFRPGKSLKSVLQIAQHVDSKFLIIGPSDKASETTKETITRLSKEYRVQDRVQLLTNKPRSVLVKVLSEAKIFLHTQFYEAFGISIVEAMAAGCVPVVPRYGGPWFDILAGKQGRFGFSYGNPAEAAEIINLLLSDEDLRRAVSTRASARANVFDCSIFERKMVDIVQKTGAEKFYS